MPPGTLRSGNIPGHQRETAGRQHLHIGPSVLRGSSCVTLLLRGAFTRLRRSPSCRNGEVLILNVRPRSYLDAGNVVPVGSLNFPTSGYGQTVSYLNLPPYLGQRERFGAGGY